MTQQGKDEKIFPGEDEKKKKEAKEKTGKAQQPYNLKEHMKFLDDLLNISDPTQEKGISPKEAMLALDKDIAKKFGIQYVTWQEKFFDGLFMYTGINVYKAGLVKKVKEYRDDAQEAQKDANQRDAKIIGRADYDPTSANSKEEYLRQKRRVPERQKGLTHKLAELEIESGFISKEYLDSEQRLDEIRTRLDEIETSIDQLENTKNDKTARAKIATYRREQKKLDLEKTQVEIAQQRYFPAASGHDKQIESVNNMIHSELTNYRHTSYVAAVANAKMTVLQNYINDRNKGMTVQETIRTIKKNARNIENIDEAIEAFDEVVNEGVKDIREIRERIDGNYTESKASQELKNNVDEGRAQDTEFMAEFVKRYGY